MSDTPITDAHRTVAKWLNEETDYIPYLEIAEVCAELAKAQARVQELEREVELLVMPKETKMVEVGVVRAHPLVMMYKHCKTVFKTWMFARKHNIPADEWYGVYEAGTETVIAHMGCTALSKGFAQRLTDAENEWRSKNQEGHNK